VTCAIDRDDHAPKLITAARTLADGMRCDVRVVHVVARASGASPSDDPAGSHRLLLSPRTARSAAQAEEEVAQREADAEAIMLRLGTDAEEGLVLQGNAALQIRAYATRCDASMLVIGTRGRGSVKAALLGSVSRELLRSAPCPVMVMPDRADGSLQGEAILCGVDDDERGDEAVSVAAGLAAALDRRLVLAHVAQRRDAAAARLAEASLPVEELPTSPALGPARLLHDARRRVPAGLDVKLVLRQGVAVDELAALARDLGAAAIVVATRGPGRVSTTLGGSVAQELTTHSRCPVVVVPPVAR